MTTVIIKSVIFISIYADNLKKAAKSSTLLVASSRIVLYFYIFCSSILIILVDIKNVMPPT